MEVGMVTKTSMEVFITTSGKLFDNVDEAIEQDKRDELERLAKFVLGDDYLEDIDYTNIADFIYDNFEDVKEIVERS